MRITKRSARLFFASAFITALFILFGLTMLSAETNTRKTGLTSVSVPLSFKVSESSAELTVNDRDYVFSVKPIFDVFTSKAFNAVLGLWLLF